MLSFPGFPQNFNATSSAFAPASFQNGNALAAFSPGGSLASVPALGLSPLDQTAFSSEIGQAQPSNPELLTNFMQAWGSPSSANGGEAMAMMQQALMMLAQLFGIGGLSADPVQSMTAMPLETPGANGFGGGSLAGGGGGGSIGGRGRTGGGGAISGGGGGAVSGPSSSGSSTPISTVPPELAGDDQKLAAFIDKELKGTPLAGQGLGAHFVKAGRENKVDPLALLAISRHETGHGKLGVGVTKHMGVGAYDSNPNGKTKFDGAVQQIYSGAKTFANLREKGGSNANESIDRQLSAVNKGGWATDKNWHKGVGKHYSDIANSAKNSLPKEPKEPKGSKTTREPETVSV